MHKIHTKFLAAVLCAAFFTIASTSPAQAFTFDKNNIITDGELTNSASLSAKGIESFLKSKGSILSNYRANDVNGNAKLVSQIIYDTAKKYKLNAMLFLVMAQKESGAITSSRMTYSIDNWVLGFGRCDSCSESEAAPYRGLARQFDSAGKQFRNRYLTDLENRGYTVSGWGPGRTKVTADGISVTPKNNATAALYTYNPWVGAYGGGDRRYGANSLFAKLWTEWNPSYRYPDGSLLQIGNTVYLIQDNKKRPFRSQGALLANYNPKQIIAVPSTVGELYKNGKPINYPNYSLLRSPKGTIYLTVDNARRGFSSMKSFRSAGFNEEEVIEASWRDLNGYKEGKKITEKAKYPGGAIIQNSRTGAMAWVAPNASYKRNIISRTVLENRFGASAKSIMPVSEKEFKSFKKKPALKLKDGTLVSSHGDKSVYLISKGKRLPFESRKTFDALGYQWKNIEWVEPAVLKLHPKGKTVKPTKSETKTKKSAEKKGATKTKTTKKK